MPRARVALIAIGMTTTSCAWYWAPATIVPPGKRCPERRKLSEEELANLRPVKRVPGEPYWRTCEVFPSVPRTEVPRRYEPARAEICVHPEGFVYDARLTASTGDVDLDKALVRSLSTWRYRPMLREGRAVAFCHPLRIDYFARPR
jgi:hypothetical protein